jgi:hypothetical protein
MGNRGTTPSWDDEQIARYGLFPHLNMVASRFRDDMRRRHVELVEENISAVLALLPESTEETKLMIAHAIPRTLSALDLGDMAIEHWRESVAYDVYNDYCVRTGQKFRTPFPDLSLGYKKQFFDILDAITEVWKMKHEVAPTAKP